jgi:hypothetical protein
MVLGLGKIKIKLERLTVGKDTSSHINSLEKRKGKAYANG